MTEEPLSNHATTDLTPDPCNFRHSPDPNCPKHGVWAIAAQDPAFISAMEEGLADLKAGRFKPYQHMTAPELRAAILAIELAAVAAERARIKAAVEGQFDRGGWLPVEVEPNGIRGAILAIIKGSEP